MVNASMVSSAFLVAGISAWSILRNRERETMLLSLKLALAMAIVVAPLQAFLGDQHGLNTLAYQPIKVAAMEGHWETVSGAPLILFAWPDMALEKNLWEVSIPYLGSIILTHSLDGTLVGLKTVAAGDRPYVPLVFFSFRIMVGIGVLLIAMAAWGQWLRHRGRLRESRRYLWLLIPVAPLGLVATIAGWVTTEAGRQPWVVQGLLRTADAVSPELTTGEVVASLVAICIAYTIIMLVFLGIGARLVSRAPEAACGGGG
jgi:cytochrome d ubiquinol oxidase subunit I